MKSPKDFQRAFRRGNRARGDLLVVAVVENGAGQTRLGLSIGKSVWKGAVQRNRVRRIFREAFRLSRPELPAGLDIIMMAAGPGLKPGLEDTRRELLRLVPKAHGRYLAKLSREADEGSPSPPEPRA